MKTGAFVGERERKIERKNRRLGTILIILAAALMTASFVLMKIYQFVPAPPK
ncbi:MAG: hypothetical protein L0Z48_11375 [candidate division Zixibacteria bacterium]|nr:hypothetical protein [candidate division Zixibacteria bacterium]MCI0597124.1 hypothetical protein [candidate division Zixibacteria bacterium]